MNMSAKNRDSEKRMLHQRNRNRTRYDLAAMMITTPALKDFVKTNKALCYSGIN